MKAGALANESSPAPELTVRGEPIERAYSRYATNRFLVNRRYQRKLIWTMEEKRKFIDSIIKGYPIPIILLAENKTRNDQALEIIDGMQRLNAISSFIENEFSLNSEYFDLQTMAETKAKLDNGDLIQKTPVMAREKCVSLASYLLPLSIYEFGNADSVDEVFRRINSGGRQLSRQELRAAGATGAFAQAVRKIASKIRGDDSARDILSLNDMKLISITNRELSYGIDIEGIFWVREGILTKEQVRQSRDEELIANLVAYMSSDEPPSSRAEFIDDYFFPGSEETSSRRYSEMDASVRKRSEELVIRDFQQVFDDLAITLKEGGATFGRLLFPEQPPARAPRYFQAVFLALHELIVKQNKIVKDRQLLVRKLTAIGPQLTVSEGGRWGAEARERTVNGLIGIIQKAFKKAAQTDPATTHWVSQFENLLTQSTTEQSLFDFKQGFLKLADNPTFDDDAFSQIMRTCAAISNVERGARGYVIVGVADKEGTAERVKTKFGVDPRKVGNFFVTGVAHEAKHLNKSEEQYFQYIVDLINKSALSNELRLYISRNLKYIRYFEKSAFIFEVYSQKNVSTYDGRIYTRSGPSVNEVETEDLPSFIASYLGVG